MTMRICTPTLALCCPILLALAGCKAGPDDPSGEDTDGIAVDDDADDDAPNDDSDDDDEPPPPDAKGRCESSVVGPPLMRRLTRAEFENTIRDAFPMLGGNWGGVAMGPDPLSNLGFSNGAATLEVGKQTANEILRTVEDVASLVTDPSVLPNVLSCANTGDQACARTFVEQTGRRLFRRPLTSDEVQTYVDHHTSIAGSSNFATGIKWTLVALLQSPHTLYRSEVGEVDDDVRRLTPYEIASELAYDFGGTAPSEALIAMAESGRLDDPEVRVQQARQLLATERGREIVHRFFREWLGYRQIESETRSDQTFMSLRSSMAEETRRFIETIVFEQGGDVRDLLLADFTVLDAGLSQYYGFGSVSGDFQVVTRPPEWGVGILSQASFLATYAHPEYSSPTLRGLAVFSRVLCNERPPVPNDVPALSETEHIEAKTTRERYENVHVHNEFCATCHDQFDPLGFAFEHFDQYGRYRASENGNEIDATGTARIGKEAVDFDGATEFAQRAADSDTTTDCVSGLLSLYTFGGAGGELCVAEEARTQLAEGDIGLLDFIASLAASDHFVERRRK